MASLTNTWRVSMKSLASKLFLLGMVLALQACQNLPGAQRRNQEVVVIPPTYSENIVIPKVEPTSLKSVQWKLMNRVELEKFLKANPNGDYTLYTLDDGNMTILLDNIQGLKRYVQSQQAVIEYLLTVIDARRLPDKKEQ